MDRRSVLSVSGAMALAALAGCVGEEDDPENSTNSGTSGPQSPSNDTTSDPAANNNPPTGDPGVDDAALAELASGNATFALELSKYLATEQGGNLFVSPYSISTALAMTYAGARGETRTAMEDTMRYTLGEEVHAAFEQLQDALDSRETTQDPVNDEEVDAFTLQQANSLWAREDFQLSEEFLDLQSAHYEAGLRRADFGGDPEGARDRINDWVADNTEDRIENLLPEGSITPNTLLVLANAIYFMASWYQEFDPDDTEDGTFTALDGSESTVPFMHQNIRTNYASLPGAQAVELPYVGEEVSMVLVLPDEGNFEAYERELDAEQLFGVFQELSDTRGNLAMPRFEFETEVQLSDALRDMGMEVAFGSGADFSGMTGGEGGGLWIDEVYHKGFVSVDEEGTEAAAATAVVMVDSAPPDWGECRFDRPFLFCIRDRPTDAILFLGRVVDAGAAQ